MAYLILVRHGESMWNCANKFTGWVDVPLSDKGIRQARSCAKKLAGLKIDIAFTSKLERAQETLLIILSKQKYTGIFLHKSKKSDKWGYHPKRFEKNEIPIYSSYKLNERFYGKLQGINKDVARKKWGKPQVFEWRRSYDTKPPGGESLKDTVKRAVPYFKSEVIPNLKKGKNVIVSAHGNSLRGIIKYIDKISSEEISHLDLRMGIPIVYKYSKGKLIRDKKHKHFFTRPCDWN
jgi:2,3-bisphosphoglycerate-dependent phosphoglycerate mutase